MEKENFAHDFEERIRVTRGNVSTDHQGLSRSERKSRNLAVEQEK